jgi:hypothetical protein
VLAVLPFSPATSDTSLVRLGRDLASTVSASLDGVVTFAPWIASPSSPKPLKEMLRFL